jgi:response regulator NasT
MNRPLRIVVADDEPRIQQYFRRILPLLGHQVVAVAQTGRELVDLCRSHQPDLIITDIKMSEMDGIEAAVQICNERPLPIILVSAYHDTELIERAEANHVLAYLIKPIKQAHLEPAIALAVRRFEQFQALRQEAADLRQALADRKKIERAKGVLMRQAKLDEEEAFRRMQKMARDRNQKLVEVAEIVLAVGDALTRPADSA